MDPAPARVNCRTRASWNLSPPDPAPARVNCNRATSRVATLRPRLEHFEFVEAGAVSGSPRASCGDPNSRVALHEVTRHGQEHPRPIVSGASSSVRSGARSFGSAFVRERVRSAPCSCGLLKVARSCLARPRRNSAAAGDSETPAQAVARSRPCERLCGTRWATCRRSS